MTMNIYVAWMVMGALFITILYEIGYKSGDTWKERAKFFALWLAAIAVVFLIMSAETVILCK